MAFFSLKMVGAPLPAGLGEKRIPTTTKTSIPLLQLKSEKGWKTEVPINLSVSRRDMMIYLTAGILSGPTEPVEARVVKPEIRRKIREKLDMLREKAGLSKLKNENGMKTPPAPPSAKEKELSLLPPLPIPSPNSKKPLVEATLP
ncbi:hypothetical protein RGQ29_002185 [Quercus rubra]|uniref:Uncharacterized protein n=1 Tax=Quercus rubra TaxID=3512 RepID=A0AAN7GBN4_QUERU|nr:hypothetical protein RGQ29_002185 [Quercus rubra]